MVFPKKLRDNSKTQFEKGSLPFNKGKILSKASQKVDIKPFMRLPKNKMDVVLENAENPPVRFLRPKEIQRPEVEKCALACESNPRYENFPYHYILCLFCLFV